MNKKELVKKQEKVGVNEEKILGLIRKNNSITYKEMSKTIGISDKATYQNIEKLKSKGLLKRVGSDKTSYWEAAG